MGTHLLLISLAFLTVQGDTMFSDSWRKQPQSSVSFYSNATRASGVRVGSLLGCAAECFRAGGCFGFCVEGGTGGGCFHGSITAPLTTTWPAQTTSRCYVNGCPVANGYAMYSGRCVKLYMLSVTQPEAQAACRLDGGHLYDVTYDQDLSAVSAIVIDSESALYVGATGNTTNGYHWSDGRPLPSDSPLWNVYNPNQAYGVNCVVIRGYVTGVALNDAPCTLTRPFLCQVD